MKDRQEIANLEILISHSAFYKRNRGIRAILGNYSRHEIALKLSILSFSHKEERNFRRWSIAEICKSDEQVIYASDKAVYSRLQIWRLWVELFKNWNHASRNASKILVLSAIHEAFAKINDRKYDDADNFEQHIIKISASQSRDSHPAKFHRARKLFLTPSNLSLFVAKFEKTIGVTIELYINILYLVINILHR